MLSFANAFAVRRCTRVTRTPRTRWRCTQRPSVPSSHEKSFPVTRPIRKLALDTLEDTHLLGELLASNARAGDIICLSGCMGAGKTAFARSYIRHARNDPDLDVTSPTYLLDNTYPPPYPVHPQSISHTTDNNSTNLKHISIVPTIHHMDLWRLENVQDRVLVDFDQAFTSHICLIEWPDRLGDFLPQTRLDIVLSFADETREKPAAIVDIKDASFDWGFDDDDGVSATPPRIAALQPHGERWTTWMNTHFGSSPNALPPCYTVRRSTTDPARIHVEPSLE